MNIIQNNSYRILGLLVGATATQFRRHRTRIPNYIIAGADIPTEFTDCSFARLGNLHRTIESVTEANSKLNLDSDKMLNALFWFYKGNIITDEPAFDAIQEGDLDQVLNIWSKLTIDREVSQRNASAFNNLGTLYLSGILDGTDSNENALEQGVSLKLKFLESDFIKDLKVLATDETFKTTKRELQLLFLNQVQEEINKPGGVPIYKFLEIINKQSFTAKEDFLKDFVQQPIRQIEKQIEETKTKRKANKANLINLGEALFQQTSEGLSQIKSILGPSNLKASSITDKVSNEILQCGIEYFNGIAGRIEISDIETVKKLLQIADSIAMSNITKQRCIENTDALNEIIKEIEKNKYNDCYQVIDFLNDIVIKYKKQGNRVDVDKNGGVHVVVNPYVDNSKVKQFLKRVLTDKILTKIATSNNDDLILNYVQASENLFSWMGWSLFVISRTNIFKNNLPYNSKYIDKVKTNSKRFGKKVSSIAENATTGCYIATMAYGDYNHPQVMILRQFRDEVLGRSLFGKAFIKMYYYYSPKLVMKLKNKKSANLIIRMTLNQFIKLIK